MSGGTEARHVEDEGQRRDNEADPPPPAWASRPACAWLPAWVMEQQRPGCCILVTLPVTPPETSVRPRRTSSASGCSGSPASAGRGLRHIEDAPTAYDAATFFWNLQPRKKKEKKNAGESVRCYFRTRSSILGDS